MTCLLVCAGFLFKFVFYFITLKILNLHNKDPKRFPFLTFTENDHKHLFYCRNLEKMSNMFYYENTSMGGHISPRLSTNCYIR